MEKKHIIANERNLRKALRASAKAHNADFVDFRKWDPHYIGITSKTVPVIADVQSILEAFTENGYTDYLLGHTLVDVGRLKYRTETDEMTLRFALPFNAKIKWEKA